MSGYLSISPGAFTLAGKTFSAEASDLAFPAGRWPVTIEVTYAGKTYRASTPVFYRDGEGDTTHVEYFAPGGYRFLVWND